MFRRRRLAQMFRDWASLSMWGFQTKAAKELGVSRSTICRDYAWLRQGCPPRPPRPPKDDLVWRSPWAPRNDTAADDEPDIELLIQGEQL
jgi:hypothetical protein